MTPQPFPRGTGPLISVLMCTRGRPTQAQQAINSLFSNATNPNNLELLIKIDDDDPETQQALNNTPYGQHIKVLNSPRGQGFRENHVWLAQLASMSEGDWILIAWNDDATMLTPNWDTMMKITIMPNPAARAGIFAMIPEVESRPGSAEFLFIRRKYWDIFRTIAVVPAADSYLFQIFNILNATSSIPIRIRHSSTGDGEIADQTAREHSSYNDNQLGTLHTSPVLMSKVSKVLTLQSYIDYQLWKENQEHHETNLALEKALRTAVVVTENKSY